MTNYVKTTDFAAKDNTALPDSQRLVKGTEFEVEFDNIADAIASKANTASPALTGVPTAPTAVAGTNTTQLATTAFVINERTATGTLTNKTLTSPVINGGTISGISDLAVVDGGTGASNASAARTNLGLTIGTDVAPVASPSFSGTPTAPTASFGTNTTQLATTAFVQAALQAVFPVGSIYIGTTATSPATLFGFGTWEEFGAGRVLVGQNTGDASFNTLGETGGSKDAIVVSHLHYTYDSRITGVAGARTSYSNPIVVPQYGETAYIKTSEGGSDYYTWGIKFTSGEDIKTSTTTGSSGTNANLQPYVVVKMWKRTA